MAAEYCRLLLSSSSYFGTTSKKVSNRHQGKAQCVSVARGQCYAVACDDEVSITLASRRRKRGCGTLVPPDQVAIRRMQKPDTTVKPVEGCFFPFGSWIFPCHVGNWEARKVAFIPLRPAPKARSGHTSWSNLAGTSDFRGRWGRLKSGHQGSTTRAMRASAKVLKQAFPRCVEPSMRPLLPRAPNSRGRDHSLCIFHNRDCRLWLLVIHQFVVHFA